MPVELDDFYKEFLQDIYISADANSHYIEDSFFDQFCGYLIDAGEIETADRVYYAGTRGLRVDGYGGDPWNCSGTLSLIVSDFIQSSSVSTLTATEMDAIFKRCFNFAVKSLDPAFRSSLEETDPGFGLADMIAKRWSIVEKIRIILISNRLLSSRVEGKEASEVADKPCTYVVWDLSRLQRLATTGHGREEIVIDLMKEYGTSLPALPAHLTDATYEAYLVVVPAKLLAAIYDRWGARLLEQNVRVFLQARGNVNKGIKNTIDSDPEMFFAYNNGITATAESVQLKGQNGSVVITGLTNLQIVNGGQTTASIHAASRKAENNLSKVFVQMKLSIIEPASAEAIVPRISEFANSQNKIRAADFFSNHPFHLRIAEFSRRIYAPSADGNFRESKWFYERMRGQYYDARSKLTHAQARGFDVEYPKNQIITKTDLAKYLNAWSGFPNVVSKGAEKNFAQFALNVGRDWVKNPDDFNEMFFRHGVCKAIIFRQVEKIVSKQPWYQGAYRSSIVPYAIAKLAADVEQGDNAFSFDVVWKSQALTTELLEAFAISATAVHSVIIDPPAGMHNVIEWSKTEACWTRASSLRIDWPAGMLAAMRNIQDKSGLRRQAIAEQKMLNGVEAQVAVVKAGMTTWKEIKQWGIGRGLLSQVDQEFIDVAISALQRVPSERQSLRIMEILARLRQEGLAAGKDIGQQQ